jgi:hypothetical protein
MVIHPWRIWGNKADFEHVADAFYQLSLKETSDRAIAVIGGAVIESYLTEALRIYLHKKPTVTKDLFSITGALGNFAPKCDLAFLVGLVGEDAYSDLKTISKIRNAFAHKLDVKDFQSEKIRTLARNLRLPEIRSGDSSVEGRDWQTAISDRQNLLTTARGRFVISVHVFSVGLTRVPETAMPDPLF